MSDRILTLLSQPWAIVPDALEEIGRIYMDHVSGAVSPDQVAVRIAAAREARGSGPEQRSYLVQDGVAVVPMVGVMGRRMNMFRAISGGVSTQVVGNRLAEAAADSAVKSIILEVDSPGGTVDGTQDLARIVRKVDAEKPVITIATGLMASAGYWVGSAAREVYATEDSAEIGSIGVVATHIDRSRAYDKAGVRVTEITAGRYKRITSDTAPLSDEGEAYIQAALDTLYRQFVSAVATHRGSDPDTVHERMADGRVFLAADAVDRGMLDGVMSFDEGFQRARASTVRSVRIGFSNTTGKDMDLTKEVLEQQHPEIAKAVRAEGYAEGEKAGAAASAERAKAEQDAAVKAAVEAERERVAAIEDMAMPGLEDEVAACKRDGTSAGEAAQRLMKVAKASAQKRAADLDADAPSLVPQAGADPTGGEESKADKAAKAKAHATANGMTFAKAFAELYPNG